MNVTSTFALALVLAGAAAAQEGDVLFKSDVRLVEVYATVMDQKGKYLDGLTRDRFEVRDNGTPQPLAVFETESAGLSCAILMDTTGSMAHALSAVKNAAATLIDSLRPIDSVAIYSFSNSLRMLQDFTTDKAAAKRAMMRTRPAGETALFDSLSQLARDLARRTGKKAIVAFTDGADNVSGLNASAAIARARKSGLPIYAAALGDALKSPLLLDELKQIAQNTGGQAYRMEKPADILTVFEDISRDLKHTYLLAYRPPPTEEKSWRTIHVTVSGLKSGKIRAREGYLPE
ncbi:MAG TPA: VWA domain-containing protein [Bryobacteraceae bacterium]